MSSENVQELLTELKLARAVLEPQIEGLKDYQRLNIQPDTKTKVDETLARFEQRAKLINEAIAALEKLDADAYPDVPVVSVVDAVFDDLRMQKATIGAAFDLFSAQAETLGVKVGAPVEK